MEYRTLGSTGVMVSTHCLGAMMFGAWGNTDVDESVRIIHAALGGSTSSIPPTCIPLVSPRRSSDGR